KNENPSTWNIPQIQRNLELLIRIALPEIHRGDPDSEHEVARVGARLWRLANHFEALDQGKSSDYPNADEEVLEIRARLKADPEARAAFAEALTVQSPPEFIGGLLDVVQRWS